LLIHQDVALYATVLQKGERVSYEMTAGRSLYLQVARGSVRLNDEILQTGDAAKVDPQQPFVVDAVDASELLLFDLPAVN
jgi:redox-sensitive bicupin YhaK (pirin superfamily)